MVFERTMQKAAMELTEAHAGLWQVPSDYLWPADSISQVRRLGKTLPSGGIAGAMPTGPMSLTKSQRPGLQIMTCNPQDKIYILFFSSSPFSPPKGNRVYFKFYREERKVLGF